MTEAKFLVFRLTAVAALACLFARGALAAPAAVPAKKDATLSPSQFVGSVLRELMPATTVDEIEAQARTVAFELNKEAYRAMPNGGEAEQYRDAPAAFQHWLDQTLTSLSKQLSSHSKEYRTGANEFDELRSAINGLSKIKFTKPQVEFVAQFLRSYFSAENPSMSPRDILKAFRQALAEANSPTEKKGEKLAAQFRQGITADVGAAASEAVAPAATEVAAAPAATTAVAPTDTAALEQSVGFMDKIMNALDRINDIPTPIKMLLSVAFPPLNPILEGIKTVTCFWKAKGAWSFESMAAWSPWMYCNVGFIKMLPIGPELTTGLTMLFKVMGWGLAQVPPPAAAAPPAAVSVSSPAVAAPPAVAVPPAA